jgi:hypothetical protein
VSVAPSLALSYAQDEAMGYEITTGLHFGTVHRPDVLPADPETWEPQFWEQLADPKELIDIWAADCWLMNLDRGVYGNLLLEPGRQGKWHLIAADQSDCFLGAGALADGSCFTRSRTHGPVDYLPLLELTFLNLGCAPLRQMVSRIKGAVTAVSQAAVNVPDEWWRQAYMSREAVVDCLCERVNRIRQIVETDKWEGAANATQGGRLLGL